MDRRELFFRDIERGDMVIGRISSIPEGIWVFHGVNLF